MKATNTQVRILYVDDEINVTSAIYRQFKGKYDLFIANNGNEALGILLNNDAIAVIIVDYCMPYMNGIELIQKARLISPKTVFIMLTGYADLDLAINALHEEGIYRFLTKPCSVEVLEKSIEDAIENYEIAELKNKLSCMAQELENANKTLNVRMAQLQELNCQLEVEHKENENEIRIAKEIFERLIFSHNNDKQYLNIWMSPMSIFSGDLILSARGQNDHIYVMLADFTGHGLPAAIGAPLTAYVFVSLVESGATLPEIIAELNRSLYRVLPSYLFCAAGLLEFNCNSNKLSVWNGGLPDILITRNDGSILSRIKSAHMPMGINEYKTIDLDSVVLQTEDSNMVFMYSDGIIEAMNDSGEMYGTDRLERLFNSGNVLNLLDTVKEDISNFIGDAKQNDDITLVNLSFSNLKNELHNDESLLAKSAHG